MPIILPILALNSQYYKYIFFELNPRHLDSVLELNAWQ